MFSHDAGEEIKQAFNHPLHEILEATGNQLHFLGCQTTHDNDPECDHPHHDHRVGNWDSEGLGH